MRRVAAAGLLALALALPAVGLDPASVVGAFAVAGEADARVEVAVDPRGLRVTRLDPAGAIAGIATLSDTGWLEASFGGGLAPAVGGAAPPGSGFGLWQVLGDGAIYGYFTDAAGVRRHEAGARAGSGARFTTGFRHHLREAIALNRARRPRYEALSGGASARLSGRLVALERVTLVWAAWVDWRARAWQRRGVPIVAADFVSMEHVRPVEAPPRWRGQATEAQWEALDARLGAWRAEFKRLVGGDRFVEAARRTGDELRAVEALEEAWGCHLAMTKHTLEQAGFAALNAATWSRQSGGGTDGLARGFLRGLRWALLGAGNLDRCAQAAHARGAGVLVNDLPEIPLLRALRGVR